MAQTDRHRAAAEARVAEPSAGDPLAQLRARVRRTEEAAERLAHELSDAAGPTDGTRVPPAGWDVPRRTSGEADELAALRGLLDVVRSALPPELQQRLAELVRELLLALRALIDWWLERLEARRAPAVEVEDIPIE